MGKEKTSKALGRFFGWAGRQGKAREVGKLFCRGGRVLKRGRSSRKEAHKIREDRNKKVLKKSGEKTQPRQAEGAVPSFHTRRKGREVSTSKAEKFRKKVLTGTGIKLGKDIEGGGSRGGRRKVPPLVHYTTARGEMEQEKRQRKEKRKENACTGPVTTFEKGKQEPPQGVKRLKVKEGGAISFIPEEDQGNDAK